MSRSTHIVESNAHSRGPLIDSVRPYPDALRFALNRLNGSNFWAYSLWRAPADADLLDDIPVSDEYLQSAGTAQALTIEVRFLDDHGVAHQYTVGKAGAELTGEPTETIRWDEGRRSVKVYPHEVFTADEAAEVFYAYFLTDEVSGPYVLRELGLN